MLSPKVIDTIKNIVKIKDIVEGYVRLKKTGNRYVGCCPFHNERTPSFFISEEGNYYKCFGCGDAGDAITFIEKIENINFIEAIEIIGKKYNIAVEINDFGNESKDEIEYKEKKNAEIILKEAEKIFKENLTKEKIAIEYIKKRNINEDIINEFNLGYSNGNLFNHLKQNKYNTELAKKLGLIKYNEVENFKDRLIIPIRDSRNTIVGFGARIINEKTSEAKYINSNDNILFHKSNILFNLNIAKNFIFKENNAYIAEGYFDVISLHKIGIKNTVASCGTSLTDSQCLLLKKYTNLVTLFYDNDDAGKKATIRAINKLLKNGLMINIVDFKNYKDPDEIINNEVENARTFIKKSEIDLITFMLSHFNYKNETDINKKNNIIHYISDLINLTKDDIYKNLLITRLNELTKINIINSTTKNKQQIKNSFDNNEIIEKYEDEIISTLFKYNKHNNTEQQEIIELINKLDNYNFENKINNKIFNIFKNIFYSNEDTNLKSIISKIEDNEVKKKIINYYTAEHNDLNINLIKRLNKDSSNKNIKKNKNINTLLLKIKLYQIKSIIKNKKELMQTCTEDNNKNNLINEIIELKKEEKTIANMLKIVII